MYIMNKSKYIAMAAAAAMALTMAGCGSSGDNSVAEVTPTPMATPTPSVAAVTVTPMPTSTPAPKMIGTKTAQAKFIYLSNNLQSDIRELYLRASGDEEGDWGNNLISAESSLKASEQVQMYYGGTSSSESSTDTQSTSAKYDMKLVTADGNSYEIYSVNLGDMEKAALLTDKETSSVYLRYMSLSTKKETDTRGNSSDSSDVNSTDSSSSDNSSSDNSSSDNSSSSSSSNSSSDNSSSSSSDSSIYKGSEREISREDYDSEDGWQWFLRQMIRDTMVVLIQMTALTVTMDLTTMTVPITMTVPTTMTALTPIMIIPAVTIQMRMNQTVTIQNTKIYKETAGPCSLQRSAVSLYNGKKYQVCEAF